MPVLFSFLQLADDEGYEVLAKFKDFMVVVYDWHFKIESGELIAGLALEICISV